MGCGPRAGRRRRQSDCRQSPDDIAVGPNKQTILMPQVPEKCFNCGASIQPEKVNWIGPNCLECPYCGQALTVHFERID